MKRMLLALAFSVLPATAIAQPPLVGSTYTFYDPLFTGTVFCDTLEQVRSIVTSRAPDEVYATLASTPNDRNEPICLAIVPTATVVDVTHVGFMERDGSYFRAWAVRTDAGGTEAYALYIEPVDMEVA